MPKTLKLNLITPQKQLLSDLEVESVVLPAFQGELGVLPGHIPMMVQLGFGSLRYKQDGKEEEFAVLPTDEADDYEFMPDVNYDIYNQN